MIKPYRASRKLAALAAAAVLLGQGPAMGDERVVSTSIKALDALCISTQLDKSSLDAKVQSFAHRKLPHQSVRKMSPYNEAGYAVIVDRAPVTVTLGRRQSQDETSRNCTVTIKDLSFSDAMRMLQSRFLAKELDRFSHGLSQIAVYRAALASYDEDMFFSVQSGGGITAISFFETPSAKTPSAKTPSAKTPSAKTPGAKTR